MMCGWCITNNHETCMPQLAYFDKVWYCECKTCKKQEKEEVPNGTE